MQPGSTAHTDELRSYLSPVKAGYEHREVHHGRGEYLNGDSHVNAVDGFRSRLKNAIRGTHVHVSAKQLHKYVKQLEYRRNRRKRLHRIFLHLISEF